MNKNELIIIIDQPTPIIYKFAITPPNSTKWIPGVVKEETSELPIKVGTIYFLTDENNKTSKVTV